MLETSTRLLDLLSLLQARREWRGPELAERLGVAPRTIRRDVERLRRLGYPVEATRGIAGGYSLARAAEKINLKDIAEVVDGIALERCALSLASECPGGRCNIQRTLRAIEEEHLTALSRVSLAHMAAGLAIKTPK